MLATVDLTGSQAVAGVIVAFAVLLGIAGVGIVFFFKALRRFIGVDVTIRLGDAPRTATGASGVAPAEPTAAVPASAATTEVRGTPGPFDVAERGLGGSTLQLLYAVMVTATGVAAFCFIVIPHDANRSLLLMYVGVVYGITMLWLVSRVASVRRRLNVPPDSVPPAVPMNRAGPAGPVGWRRPEFRFTLETEPEVHSIDQEAIERAARHLDSGGTLDEACALMDPRYRSMNPMIQKVFKKAVSIVLERRRKGAG